LEERVIDSAQRKQSPEEIGKQHFLLFGLPAAALASETLYLTLVRFDAIDGFRPVATFVGLMMALFAVCGIAFLLIERIRLWKKAALLIVVLGSLCFRITMIPAGLPPHTSVNRTAGKRSFGRNCRLPSLLPALILRSFPPPCRRNQTPRLKLIGTQ
jgi:hypothetical protein